MSGLHTGPGTGWTAGTGPAAAGRVARLLVAERFVSVQGEGPLTGQRCCFVRLSRCNLDCRWCDTPETWDWSRFDPREVADWVGADVLAAWVADTGVDLLVLTGGEPLLQQPALREFLDLVAPTVRVQVETNGTQVPAAGLVDRVDLWVVSPKLGTSGVAERKRIVPGALAALQGTNGAAFKFVVCDIEADLAEIEALASQHGLAPIWVMPEGATVDEVVEGTAALRGPADERGWNLSTRLHVLAGAR